MTPPNPHDDLNAQLDVVARTKPKSYALAFMDRIIADNPDPDDPALRLIVLQAYRWKFDLTDANPPAAKEHIARDMLALADAWPDAAGKRLAANARFRLAHSSFFMSDAHAHRTLMRELVDRFGNEGDVEIRRVVARTRMELVFPVHDTREHKRLLEGIVADYRDSDDAELAQTVAGSAQRLYFDLRELGDEQGARALCFDMLARYGKPDEADEPHALSFFRREKLRRFDPPEEQISQVDARLAALTTESSIDRLSEILELFDIKRDAMGLPSDSGDIASWCRELAEKSSPALAARLFDCAAHLDGNDAPVRREVADLTRPSGMIEALTAKAAVMRDSNEAAGLYDRAVAIYAREYRNHWLLPPEKAMRGLLVLTPDGTERAALLDRFIPLCRMNTDGRKLEHEFMVEKARLTADPEEKKRILDEVVAGPEYEDQTEANAQGWALLERAGLEDDTAKRLADYDRILDANAFRYAPDCRALALRGKAELLGDANLPIAYAREYLARKITPQSARTHVLKMAEAFDDVTAAAMRKVMEET